MPEPLGGLTKGAAAKVGQVMHQVLGRLPDVGRRTRRLYSGGGGTGTGGCVAQNAIIDVTVFGVPTGGTFDLQLTVNAVTETLTFNWDDTAAEVKTELATHTQIASTDLTVTGGNLPNATVRIKFIATLADTNISLPLASWGSLTGGTGVAVIASLAQLGHA